MPVGPHACDLTACSASTWKIEQIPIPGIGNHREILEALKRFKDFGGPKRGVTFCDAMRTLNNLALLSLLKSDEMSYFNLLKSVSTVIMLDKLKESTTSGPECVRAEVFIPVSQWSVLFLFI